MFQLFCSVSLLFLIFNVVYSLYLYFAVGYYQSKLILKQKEVIVSEGQHKFDTIFNETMRLVDDYFDLTMQKIDRDAIIIVDRLSEDDEYGLHPVAWKVAQPKSQKRDGPRLGNYEGT